MRRACKVTIAAVTLPCLALAQTASRAVIAAAAEPNAAETAALADVAQSAQPAPNMPTHVDRFGITWEQGPLEVAQNAAPAIAFAQNTASVLTLAQAAAAPAVPPAPTPTPPAAGPLTVLPELNVIGATPLLGSGVDRNRVPDETQVFTPKDISIQGPPNALGALQDQAEGVHLDNSSGNPFQQSVYYHGFVASPLQGTPQQLAVYVNGVRFNQAFGDTVNWDLIPSMAIERMNLEGANPVFGLNALGGAISVQLKNGFTYHGAELDAFGGSFGQVAGEFQYGKQSGNTAIYIAGTGEHEGGWRDGQSSGLTQLFADIGWRGDRGELHLSIDTAHNVLSGPGTVPVQLLAANPSAQFTAPNWIKNDYAQVNLNANWDVTDTTSLQALTYYNNFLQRVGNGNGSPLVACNDGSGNMCESPGVIATDRNNNPIPAFLGPNGSYGSLAMQTTNTNGYGASFQVNNKDDVFGLKNNLIAGFSFDGADSLFDANTFFGALDPISRIFLGPDIPIDLADGSIAPVRARITNAYYGAFLTDTLNITPSLAANLAGRFNAAQIDITDLSGGPLTGNHTYNRFNPALGLTYKFSPAITLYGSYAESNRAPTPAELTCSDPSAPCSLANFFTGDPNLKQVVSRTFEVGLRGQIPAFDTGKINWNLSAYRSNLDDDIIFVTSPILGTGYFQNIGTTRRQGVDAGLRYNDSRWNAWIEYSYVDATFQNAFLESSPYNPGADVNGNIAVSPGDRLPGIPANILKIGVQYKATDKWTVGAVGVAATGQYLFGDEANLTQKLPGYFVLNLNTSYQVTKNFQVFALIENAFDARYYSYGTFSPTTSVPLVEAPNATNTRSYNIAAPVGVFGGVKITL